MAPAAFTSAREPASFVVMDLEPVKSFGLLLRLGLSCHG